MQVVERKISHEQKQASSLLAYSVMPRLGIGGVSNLGCCEFCTIRRKIDLPRTISSSHYEGPASLLFHKEIHGNFSLVSFIHIRAL